MLTSVFAHVLSFTTDLPFRARRWLTVWCPSFQPEGLLSVPCRGRLVINHSFCL